MNSLRLMLSILEAQIPRLSVAFSEAERASASEEVLRLSRELSSRIDELEASGDWVEQARARYLRNLLARIEERANALIFSAGGAK
jgi:hypothetical protein